jgi:predicted N-acetyltransferase YhbS
VSYAHPEPLRGKHDCGDFCCGDEDLDVWLHRYARHAEAAGPARTFVSTSAGNVVGYYALTVGQIRAMEATDRLLKGQPRGRPVPVLILARLAVDRRHQGKGVGRSLLQDALLRCMAAAENVGARAIIAHAREEASTFYDRFGFEASPADPLQRILLMKDARAFIEENEDP